MLSGYAGQFFESLLAPYTFHNCDIRLPQEPRAILPGTKLLYLLGERSLELFSNNANSLNEVRGCPFRSIRYPDAITLASYAPQDCFDRRDYDKDEDESEDAAEADLETDTKGHGRTKRSNWKWWLYQDTRKVTRLVQTGWTPLAEPQVCYSPAASVVCEVLRASKDQRIFFDIETDRAQNLTCFGFSFSSDSIVYVVPFKNYNGTLAYTPEQSRRIIQALCIALHSNTVVIHNAMFDLFVLAWKYKIPFPRKVFCTMIAWHRCYAEIEKSLGHLISYFLNETYHKSEGIFDPHNYEQQQSLWKYNAKDVARLKSLYPLLTQEVVKLDAAESVAQAQASIRPYLTMMYQGMKIDIDKFTRRFTELEEQRTQINRCINVVTQRNLNPRSPKQVSEYLYTLLGFKKPDKDPTDQKTLYKLLTKHPIPSVRLILLSKSIGKMASSMKFRFWGPNTDRFTTAYNIGGTETYRLGSRALLKFKPDKGFGGNAQNWDKDQRDLVIPG